MSKLFGEFKIKCYFCTNFCDEKDIKNQELKEIFKSGRTRKRGIAVRFKNKNYIFSLNSKSLIYEDEEWESLVKENGIFIKKDYILKIQSFRF